jgi:hypothetical protein
LSAVTAVQWFWTGSGGGQGVGQGSSFLVPQGSLSIGSVRLVGASQACLSDISASSRWTLGSTDVLHSLSIPSGGVKLDVLPGRAGLLAFLAMLVGLLSGLCAELCGVWHCGMPSSWLGCWGVLGALFF